MTARLCVSLQSAEFSWSTTQNEAASCTQGRPPSAPVGTAGLPPPPHSSRSRNPCAFHPPCSSQNHSQAPSKNYGNMITVFLHLFQGLDVVEIKLLCHHPTPTPLANLGLRYVPRVGGVEKGGRDAVATGLFLSCLHPTLSGGEGRATRWPGGGAVSAARIPLPQPPALPPSLRSFLVALLPAQAVRKEEQVLEGHGSAVG